MAGLFAGYWLGRAAAESDRIAEQRWELASRAFRRRTVVVDDRPALVAQVVQLQAQVQQAGVLIKQLVAERDLIFDKYCHEHLTHQETQNKLEVAERRLRWPCPPDDDDLS